MRPAAFKRGPKAKPKSLLVICAGIFLATCSNAKIPGRANPLRIRRKPCSTKIRLLPSNGTTSATVASETKSKYCAIFGKVSALTPRSINVRRKAHIT